MENILTIEEFITESNSIFLMDNETKSKLLDLDKKYGKLIEKFRTRYVAQTVDNIKEEFDKFMKAKTNGQKYYPQLEIKNASSDMKMYDDFGKLIDEFEEIKNKCYISKFYLEKIHSMRSSLEQRKKIEDGTYKPGPNPVDKELYKKALEIIKDNPYKKPDFKKERNKDAEEVKERIEDALDELGYNFDVEIDTGMLPRMNVKMGHVNINKSSRFSDDDIDGLIAHELKGHVGRRYYGKQTGLWLFAYGLQSSSIFDEGLAVWNSLHKVKHKKDNVMFNIAMKTCVSYLMFEMDFCDLFDWVKKHAKGMTDYTAFKTIVRPRRRNRDCRIMSGEPMTTYLAGKNLVDKMDNKMRNDILHYNIGPDQLFELDNIKEFLKVNKFKPLK